MRIAYFPKFSAFNSHSILQAVVDSCQQVGIATVENSLDADLAVIWSVLWNGRMLGNQQIYQHYRNTNRPVIVIDVGALVRGTTWKIAVNHINATGYYGHQDNLDYTRPKKLGIMLSNHQITNPSILIAAQHRRSLSVSGLTSVEDWINKTVGRLKNHTDRPVVVRPHPRSRLDLGQLPINITIEQPKKLSDTYDSFDLSYNYHAVVNYSSSPGILAAIHGVRPIVDSTSLAYPVGIDIADIEQEYTVDRNQWLVEIAHTEYTVEEIKEGAWIKRLAPALNL
jgi:hypothetical protein